MLSQLNSSPAELKRIAQKIRINLMTMIAGKGKGHSAPALSMADIVAALYFGVLKLDPENPAHPERDRFFLSKGHACTALYAALAERGFFPQETLRQYYAFDSQLGGHPVKGLPGVELATGSLGHGLPIAAGSAYAGKMDAKPYRVFTLLGDGELNEGSVWEAALGAAQFKLDNLVAVIDRNFLSSDGPTEEMMALEPLADKWRSFGWAVEEVDGHDPGAMVELMSGVPFSPGRPSVVIARTVKGKGVDFMENQRWWHNQAPAPGSEQAAECFRQLECRLEELSKQS